MVDLGYILNAFKITNEYATFNINHISFYIITLDAFVITALAVMYEWSTPDNLLVNDLTWA